MYLITQNINVMHKIMISKHGTATIVSTNSHTYAEMLAIGTYKELFSGTLKQCREVLEDLSAEVIQFKTTCLN